jgi:hypothetical protein
MKPDRVTQGCCNFIGEIIKDACMPNSTNPNINNINIRWAKESTLLTHWCDVMHMDRERIANRIIALNS